ncbi:glycosyltransferase [Candidatus Bathyarchaeota archaeon]|nr:glycosyltransferase [Candidatus Bathyarchaeota archaeon]
MRIAFIVGTFPKLSETFVLNQITGLLDRGHKVEIFANRPGDDPVVHPDVKKYNLLVRTHYQKIPANKFLRVIKAIWLIIINFHKNPRVILRALNVFKYGRYALSLRLLYATCQFLDKGPYDIIHCHFGPNGILGVLLREVGAIKGKIITTFHGFDVNSYVKQRGKDVYRDLFQKVDLCTVNTDFTGRKVKSLGCDEKKIVKIPAGVDLSKFPFKERKIEPGGIIKILTVARLVEKKGIEYSIKAVAKVLKNHPNIQYQIVGDGPLRMKLQKLIKQLGVQDKIKLLGSKEQEEVWRLYEKAHIFILSSVTAKDGDMEGQGLVLQEAQASGLPVISTLHNGIPEGVLDGKSGFLVPERDVDALAEKLEYLIEHPAIWPKMGYEGRKYVEEHYDINKLNDKLVEIYRKLIERELTKNG